jgi:hypothetical protein
MAESTTTKEQKLLTKTQLRQEVIKLELRTAYKSPWKRFVNNRNVVENVFAILDDCYEPLCLKDCNPEGWKAARALGGRHTFKWQEFKLRVIGYLYNSGSFGYESAEEGYDDFEDTAGGCDEVAWDAACFLLEHPEWTLPDLRPEN